MSFPPKVNTWMEFFKIKTNFAASRLVRGSLLIFIKMNAHGRATPVAS